MFCSWNHQQEVHYERAIKHALIMNFLRLHNKAPGTLPMLVVSTAEHQQGVVWNQILQSSNISPQTPTFWLNVRLPLTKAPGISIGAQITQAKLAYVIRNLNVISQEIEATGRKSWKSAEISHKRIHKTSVQFITRPRPNCCWFVLFFLWVDADWQKLRHHVDAIWGFVWDYGGIK